MDGPQQMSTQTWHQLTPPTQAGRTHAVWRWEISRAGQLTAARVQLRDRLAGDQPPVRPRADDVDRLLLTFEELASNGLRHTGAPITATVTGTGEGWLIDVSDARPESPPAPAVDRDPAFGGLGLHLVARLAVQHGWTARGARKHVWACLPHGPA
jgi:anti-sigma regulatory factor (Ser/Thr protein kinase)